MFGGANAKECFSDMYAFNPLTLVWTAVTVSTPLKPTERDLLGFFGRWLICVNSLLLRRRVLTHLQLEAISLLCPWEALFSSLAGKTISWGQLTMNFTSFTQVKLSFTQSTLLILLTQCLPLTETSAWAKPKSRFPFSGAEPPPLSGHAAAVIG